MHKKTNKQKAKPKNHPKLKIENLISPEMPKILRCLLKHRKTQGINSPKTNHSKSAGKQMVYETGVKDSVVIQTCKLIVLDTTIVRS